MFAYHLTFLQFRMIPVLHWWNQDLVGGLELLSFVYIKSERLNHHKVALRCEARKLRNIPRVWPDQQSFGCAVEELYLSLMGYNASKLSKNLLCWAINPVIFHRCTSEWQDSLTLHRVQAELDLLSCNSKCLPSDSGEKKKKRSKL